MSTFDRITNNLRDTADYLADGWQELWSKARNAITRFTPAQHEDHPLATTASRWGVLSAELRETGDSLEIMLEAPGMESQDFQISVQNQSLHIIGRKHLHQDRKEGHYYITERAYGQFERIIPLPCQVDSEAAGASYKRGVLELTLPKQKSAQLRRITVE